MIRINRSALSFNQGGGGYSSLGAKCLMYLTENFADHKKMLLPWLYLNYTYVLIAIPKERNGFIIFFF